MKKFKKVTAAVISAAIAAGAAGTLTAAAIENPLVYPEGYTECMVSKKNGDILYINPLTGNGVVYNTTCYNAFKYKLSDDAPEETYDKYLKEIYDTGYVYKSYVQGDDPRTHESIPDMYGKLKDAVAQMYEAGVIKEAYFAPMTAHINDAFLGNYICIYDFNGNEADLKAVTDRYDKDCEIAINGSSAMLYLSKDFMQSVTPIAATQLKLRKEIDDLYEGDNVIVGYMNTCLATFPETFMFNMLDPYICDIDDSGTANISDATQILASYADSAANILKASENDKMDVNGDGTVDIKDAAYVLSYYSESSAGLR